jgi:heme oxygenase
MAAGPLQDGFETTPGAVKAHVPAAGAAGAMARMREATQPIHDRFDSQLRIAHADAGLREYLDFICLMWGWLAPFEELLWNRQWPDDIDAAGRNGKARWLTQDIVACSDRATFDGLARCDSLPAMDTLARRFGVAYVIEGAQMGGQVLRRTLGKRLAPQQIRWLEGYGDEVGRKWNAFRKSAEKHLDSEADIAQAAQSARDTFESLERWFAHAGALDGHRSR